MNVTISIVLPVLSYYGNLLTLLSCSNVLNAKTPEMVAARFSGLTGILLSVPPFVYFGLRATDRSPGGCAMFERRQVRAVSMT